MTNRSGLTIPPRLLFLIVDRAHELELRPRRRGGQWRFVCPIDGTHRVNMVNGRPGLALTCHGVTGSDSPGHSLITHRKAQEFVLVGEGLNSTYERVGTNMWFVPEGPWPCRWCGCPEAKVLQALGARPKDKFPQDQASADGPCEECGAAAYMVGGHTLCLPHLCDDVELDREVIFEEAAGRAASPVSRPSRHRGTVR